MTRLTLRDASRLISSRLSATTKATGGSQIDAAELQGIFQSSPPGTGETMTLVPKATPDLTPVLEAQIAALRAVSELLRAQLTDTREECDRWRQKAERLALPPPAPVPEPLRRRQRRWWQPAW
jgi:hypothetical protein